jgi:hypothetical protein
VRLRVIKPFFFFVFHFSPVNVATSNTTVTMSTAVQNGNYNMQTIDPKYGVMKRFMTQRNQRVRKENAFSISFSPCLQVLQKYFDSADWAMSGRVEGTPAPLDTTAHSPLARALSRESIPRSTGLVQ